MIRNWKTAVTGLAIAAAALVGAAAPASAATAAPASFATSAATVRAAAVRTVSAASTQTFIGVGGSTRLAQATAQAKNDALNQAAAAGATGCTMGQPEVDASDPFFFVVTVELTCTR